MNDKPEFGVLTLISISKINPHPDNPRKDVGDVSELAESIKVNGVLQNLTVVPEYGNITGEWTGGYTAVIGHRRLAAAKLAGLKEVPCVVSDMTGIQQIRTMLTENMQRTDLTIYEQAQGFQMMLDLGDTVDQIAERAGFSKTTVRRRVKLLELDKDKFKKAEKRGATLMDYARLEEIEDVSVRNKVLDSIGTNNFRMELQSALDEQKFLQKRDAWLEVIKTFAEEDPNANYQTKKYVRNYGRWTTGDVVVPEDAGSVKYYYKNTNTDISIYIDIDQAALNAEQEKRKEEQRKQAELEAQFVNIRKAHYALRSEFVKGLSNASCKKAYDHMLVLLADVLYFAPDMDIEALSNILGVEINENDTEDEYFTMSEVPEIVEMAKAQFYKLAFCLTYCSADNEDSGYWHSFWNCGHYVYAYEENRMLDIVYKILEQMGYEMSDDERLMQSGEHPIFKQEDAKDESC